MSARAAWRLEETLGFSDVYRYTQGKAGWLAAGFPRAGELAAVPRIGEVANRDVPTCAPSDHVGDIRRRLNESGADGCVVLGRTGVVLGLARSRDLKGDADVAVEEVMNPGPVTYRPDTILAELVEHLPHSRPKAYQALVTTSDGRLVGMLRTADAERTLEEMHAQHAHHHHHDHHAA